MLPYSPAAKQGIVEVPVGGSRVWYGPVLKRESVGLAYQLRFTNEALDHLRRLRATDAARILDQCRRMLTVNPTLESKAQIKRLVGVPFRRYRMRVEEFRVFYSVDEPARAVMVIGIVKKSEADTWIARMREEMRDENSKTMREAQEDLPRLVEEARAGAIGLTDEEGNIVGLLTGLTEDEMDELLVQTPEFQGMMARSQACIERGEWATLEEVEAEVTRRLASEQDQTDNEAEKPSS